MEQISFNLPADGLSNFIDGSALAAIREGRHTYARWLSIRRTIRSLSKVEVPPRGTLRLREDYEGSDGASAWYEGSDYSLQVTFTRDRTGRVLVSSSKEEVLSEILTWSRENFTDSSDSLQDESFSMGLWHLSRNGFRRTESGFTAPSWDEIKGNYSAAAAATMERLISLRPEDMNGHLLLLWGPPGTGKTHFLSTLGREWKDWCSADLILDPEQFFSDTAYLLGATVGEKGEIWDDLLEEWVPDNKWRLLILEDCDELITAQAKSATGQGLSRLLNLTDGLLGRGRRVIVAITTNEDFRTLHPAVTRSGRCLANVQVPLLEPSEASKWLGEDVRSPSSLADLYACKMGIEKSKDDSPIGIGSYL